MKKSTIIALVALAAAVAGIVIALLAYYRRRECALCDELEEEMLGEIPIIDDDEYIHEGSSVSDLVDEVEGMEIFESAVEETAE